jgi:hypothetical protein
MSNVEKEMQELQKDLLDVLNKHGLLVLEDSVMLELSPIHIDIKSGFKTRDITISFREASLLSNDELTENIDKYGIVMEM